MRTTTSQTDSDPSAEADAATNDLSSGPFVGRWTRLVSKTNWEKGRIIQEWRDKLIEKQAPAPEYSNEAWSRLVGDISAGHVGRLRRTYERFGQVYGSYKKLFWSHFYAALDWDDAEMWLEGAVQNKWNVSQMRRQRWEAMGKVASEKPKASDIVVSEIDEGFSPLEIEKPIRLSDRQVIQGPILEGPDFGDADTPSKGKRRGAAAAPKGEHVDIDFEEQLGQLPADIGKAYRSFRKAIQRHRDEDWKLISPKQIARLLTELKKSLRAVD